MFFRIRTPPSPESGNSLDWGASRRVVSSDDSIGERTDKRQTFRYQVDFPGAGKWNSIQFFDRPGEKTKLVIEFDEIPLGASHEVNLEPGGGFVIILSKP